MGKEKIRIVLAKEETIAGIQRHPGYVLLEGVCPEGITKDCIDKAIQLNQVKVLAKDTQEESKAKEGKQEGSK